MSRVSPSSDGHAAAGAWEPDVLDGYHQRTLALGPDPDGEGEIAATLVRRGDPVPARHAVLVVHGFTDYFFNTELADHLTEHRFSVYAIDLHKCGRSWRDGQTPHFTTDLRRYDAELDWALSVIAAESGNPHVLMCGHSAGGLIVTLWLNRRKAQPAPGRGPYLAPRPLLRGSRHIAPHSPSTGANRRATRRNRDRHR